VQYENRLANFLNENEVTMTIEEMQNRIDDTEYVIGSDAFAAFLNHNGEIHVGEEIYKYTDVGLFYVEEINYDNLVSFLEGKNISKNLILPTTQNAMETFMAEIPFKGVTTLDGGIKYFISPCDDPLGGYNQNHHFEPELNEPGPCDGWVAGWGALPSENAVENLDGLEDFVTNLSVCNPSNGFLGGLFGVNKICYDNYQSKRRVRTKAFSHNYLIVYHVGVKVKHQYKGWTGFWSEDNTHLVALGVEMVQYEYDYSSLILSGLQNINPSSVKYSVKPKNMTYNVNTNIWLDPNGNQTYNLINTSTWSPNLPTVYHDDLIIEAFNMHYSMNANQLNEFFWGSVWNSAKNQLKTLTNDSSWENPLNTTLLANYPNMGKVYTQKSYFSHCTNCSKRNKTFDFDGSFTIGLGFNATSGEFSYNLGTGHLIPPKKFKFKLYGVIKENGQWHGSKMSHGVD